MLELTRPISADNLFARVLNVALTVYEWYPVPKMSTQTKAVYGIVFAAMTHILTESFNPPRPSDAYMRP